MKGKKAKKSVPLWLRALRDPEAKEWLKKNRQEFPERSFLPDRTSFRDKIVMARHKVADVIAAGMPYPEPEQQVLAELILSVTPREIAKIMGITRREAYLRVRALKNYAIKRWKLKRTEAIMARGRKATLTPAQRAVRTVLFTLGEREEAAHLVRMGALHQWVDGEGKRFTSDVQEILNEIHDHRDGFELLNAETAN